MLSKIVAVMWVYAVSCTYLGGITSEIIEVPAPRAIWSEVTTVVGVR